MPKKNIIILAVIVGLALFIFLLWSAQKARNASDQILNEFKKVDRSLDSANNVLQKESDSSYKQHLRKL